MELLLRVEVCGAGGGSTFADVVATVEPAHPIAALTDALVRHLGLPPAPGWALIRCDPGELLDQHALLADNGLVSGELVRLTRDQRNTPALPPPAAAARRAGSRTSADPPPPAAWPVGPSGGGLQVIVCSGPDVGRSRRLVPGRMSIGRDHACGLALTDPNVARLHLRLAWDGESGLSVAPADDPVGEAGERGPPGAVEGEPLVGETSISLGDVVRIGATTLAVRRLAPRSLATDGNLGDVAFHRAPYYPAPIEAKVFEPMGDVPDRGETAAFAYLAALAPLVLGIGLAVLYSPRFLIFAAFSPIVALAGYIDQRRRVRRRYGRSEARFRDKLADRCEEVHHAIAAERDRRVRGGPDLAALAERARNRTVELWVRDRQAEDFLTLRIGLGDVTPSVSVQPETRGSDDLRDEANEELRRVIAMRDVPMTLSLLRNPVVAVVGDDRDVTPMAASLLIQACCLHSPEDLVIAAMIGESRAMAGWLEWLPHVRAPSSPLSGSHVASDPSTANRLLQQLLVVAEQRPVPTDRTTGPSGPRVLVVIDRGLELEPSLVSRLLDLGPSAGFAVVWLTSSSDRVPRQAGAVVTCRSLLAPGSSIVSFTDPGLGDQALTVERLDARTALGTARALAPLRDASSATSSSSLPRTVSLHEGLQTDEIDADWILKQWRIDRGERLPATIGVSATGPLRLDLVENGPHGLIGGTSGAGKSELLTSMVATLMALNPPDRLNLLFIDYKGGASTAVFREAPHTVGSVTNLDAVLARRALTSLRAELTRRMDLLHGRAKDLAEFLAVDPERAPPALVIVIDEFATLVSEVPEFMAGIVDLAQRGRSLGIHLILATQRPSGAVSENILANTNLRISLRMLDKAESLGVIGAPDAATIPTPLKGRGFARLGPGQLVPFQTAWSGAPKLAPSGPPPVTVASLGRSRSGTLDAAGRLGVGDEARSAIGDVARTQAAIDTGMAPVTQLDGLLAAVHTAADRLRVAQARSPWLDELPTRVSLDEVRRLHRPTGSGGSGLVLPLGVVDDPEGQAQYPNVVDFDADGGLLVFGAGGSGKTTALRTLALSAALDDHERGGETLTIFGLDFASRQLTALSALPQCAAIATGDDLEAITRIVTVLEGVVERRLGVVAGTSRLGDDSPNFDRILLLVDDYGALLQTFEGAGASAGLFPWLERLNRLIVEGRQVGLHAALTAARPGVVRGAVRSAVSRRIVLRQADAAAYAELDVPAALVGDAELPPGRGFVSDGHQCQVALPGSPEADAELDDDLQPAGADPTSAPFQQRVIRDLAPTLKGLVGPGLATEALPFDPAREQPTGRPLSVVLGRADLSLDPVEIDLSMSNFAVVGDPRAGRSTALAAVVDHLTANGTEVWAAGPRGSPLAEVSGADHSAFGPPADLVPFLEDLAVRVDRADGQGGGPSPGRDGPILVVDDVDVLDDPELDSILGRLVVGGLRFAASTPGFRGYSTSPIVQAMKKARAILVLRPPTAQDVHDATGVSVALRPGVVMGQGRGVLVMNRLPTVVQLPKYF